MKPLNFLQVSDAGVTTRLLDEPARHVKIIAGGTDILAEIKEGVLDVDTLVSLEGLPGLSDIHSGPDGLDIGALVTLAQVAGSPDIAESYRALSQAASSVATPQIRNVGTVGGNLCQRPRCWYYRSPMFHCLKKGGETCFAYSGGNRYHAVLGADQCYIVHPSDLAVALVSMEATVLLIGGLRGGPGSRELPVEDLFVAPDIDILAETVLRAGEYVARVRVPAPTADTKSVYLKAKERQGYDFALSSVAAVIRTEHGVIRDARITLGGVAPVPYPVPHVDAALIGLRAGDVDTRAMGELAVRDAEPLSENGYKVRLTASLVSRAISETLQGSA